MGPIAKLASFVRVTPADIEYRPSFLEQVIRARELELLRRQAWLEDELIYGADMNPNIVLGEN